jgi:Ca2+-binding EF-hand superfamily protein
MISRAEAAGLPRLAERFDQVDANRDGQLTREEMRAFHQARAAKVRGDANNDGKVSRDEFMARAAERFQRLDVNQDGFVTADEARAKRHGRGHGHGHGGPRRG